MICREKRRDRLVVLNDNVVEGAYIQRKSFRGINVIFNFQWILRNFIVYQ